MTRVYWQFPGGPVQSRDHLMVKAAKVFSYRLAVLGADIWPGDSPPIRVRTAKLLNFSTACKRAAK